MILLPWTGAIFLGIVALFGFRFIFSKWVAIVGSGLASALGVYLVTTIDTKVPGLQSVEALSWVEAYAIRYAVGIDGVSAIPLLLVSLSFPLVFLFQWTKKSDQPGYLGLLLILQGTLYGAICSNDLFLTFFFFSLTSLPIYFLISVWGESGREQAAGKYALVSAFGQALLFICVVLVYYSGEPNSFELSSDVAVRVFEGSVSVFGQSVSVSTLSFVLLCSAFATRAPVWPVSGWFTRLCAAAPASTLALYAGVVVPVTVYLFMKVSYVLFPQDLQVFAGIGMLVFAGGVVFSTLSLLVQRDFRMILGSLSLYGSSLLFMGVMSLDSAGLIGSIYQGLTMGIALAGIGIVIGIQGSRLGHTQVYQADGNTSAEGGLSVSAPVLSVSSAILFSSVIAVPGLGGFVGQTLISMGAYSSHPLFIVIAVTAFVLVAVRLFSVYRAVFLGSRNSEKTVEDLGLIEKLVVAPLLVATILLGVYPKPLMELIRPTAVSMLSAVKNW